MSHVLRTEKLYVIQQDPKHKPTLSFYCYAKGANRCTKDKTNQRNIIPDLI